MNCKSWIVTLVGFASALVSHGGSFVLSQSSPSHTDSVRAGQGTYTDATDTYTVKVPAGCTATVTIKTPQGISLEKCLKGGFWVYKNGSQQSSATAPMTLTSDGTVSLTAWASDPMHEVDFWVDQWGIDHYYYVYYTTYWSETVYSISVTYSDPAYTVTFDANGGTGKMASQTCKVGSSIVLPESTLQKTGYLLAGWATEKGGAVVYKDGGQLSSSTAAGGTLRLIAVWKSSPTSLVTFGKNGGTGGAATYTATYGARMGTISVPTRAGYTFDGYWTSVKAGGVQYFDAKGNPLKKWDRKNAITLWAKWTAIQYKLTFGKNGGTGGDNWVTVTYGAKPHNVTVPKKPGYAFGGYWTTTGAGGVQYFSSSGVAQRPWNQLKNITLWAKWTTTIKFGQNGGTGGIASKSVVFGQTPSAITSLPKMAGYTFEGYWTTTRSGGVKYFNADGTPARKWDGGGNVTLWAKWTCPVLLDKSGGTGGSSSVTAVYGQPLPKIEIPTLEGGTWQSWTFSGYFESGNDVWYDAQGNGTRAWTRKGGSTTLHAIWIASIVPTTPPFSFGVSGSSGQKTLDASAVSSFATGYYHGAVVDGSGTFDLLVDDEDENGEVRAYFHAETAEGVVSEECTALVAGETLVLTCEGRIVTITRDDAGECFAIFSN